MTSTFQTRFKPLLLAGLLAAAGFSAFAQTPPAAPADGQPRAHRGMGRDQRDPAKMQEFMAKRAADLKARLKIEPSQEGAWTAFTTAMKPPADMRQRREAVRAEMAKLSTPERIDRMKALRAQRDAEMDKRAQATKDFSLRHAVVRRVENLGRTIVSGSLKDAGYAGQPFVGFECRDVFQQDRFWEQSDSKFDELED